ERYVYIKFPTGAWGKYFAIMGNFHLQKTVDKYLDLEVTKDKDKIPFLKEKAKKKQTMNDSDWSGDQWLPRTS
ncbi:MAG: hypothetical protein JW762_01400, partial [Dehalococcoidales bacterium]|nr:hypothetical protein [Dehalococcoidales bacterium]